MIQSLIRPVISDLNCLARRCTIRTAHKGRRPESVTRPVRLVLQQVSTLEAMPRASPQHHNRHRSERGSFWGQPQNVRIARGDNVDRANHC